MTPDLVAHLEIQDHPADLVQWDLVGHLELKDHEDHAENLVSRDPPDHLVDQVLQELLVN